MNDYRIVRMLGEGAQGRVYAVEHVASRAAYAMKVMACHQHHNDDDDDKSAALQAALREVKLVSQLRHRHVVAYVDFFVVTRHELLQQQRRRRHGNDNNDDATSLSWQRVLQDAHDDNDDDSNSSSCACGHGVLAVCLVMELCAGGDVQRVIRDAARQLMVTGGGHPLSEARVTTWLLQCVEALAHLHANGCHHRDVKPSNVLVDAQGNVKLADFGGARRVATRAATDASSSNGSNTMATMSCARTRVDEVTTTTTTADDHDNVANVVGTPSYLAPERLLRPSCGDDKADVWALGAVALELMTLHEQPVNALTLADAHGVASLLLARMTRRGFSRALAHVVLDMLQRHPDARPTAVAVLQRLARHLHALQQQQQALHVSLSCAAACAPHHVVDDDDDNSNNNSDDDTRVTTTAALLCAVCDVDAATVVCGHCAAHFCVGCDAARHRHTTRATHARTSVQTSTTMSAVAIDSNNASSSSCHAVVDAQLPSLRVVHNDDDDDSDRHHRRCGGRDAKRGDACDGGAPRSYCRFRRRAAPDATQARRTTTTTTTACVGERDDGGACGVHDGSSSSSSSVVGHTMTSGDDGGMSCAESVSLPTVYTASTMRRRDAATSCGDVRVLLPSSSHDNDDNNDNETSTAAAMAAVVLRTPPSCGVVHVPGDYATLPAALAAAASRAPHAIRRIVVAGNTVHRIGCDNNSSNNNNNNNKTTSRVVCVASPLALTAALPAGLCIVGDEPAPVLEAVGGASVLHCLSGSGSLVNFVLRHVRDDVDNDNDDVVPAATVKGSMQQQQQRQRQQPAVVRVSGGAWQLLRCRVTCAYGSGVVVGARHAQMTSSPRQQALSTGIRNDNSSSNDGSVQCSSDDDDEGAVAVVVRQCAFVDVADVGVVVGECARGVYEDNTFVRCGGCAAVLLRRASSAVVRRNHITHGGQAGVFCHDAAGTIERNVVAHNGGCGVIVKGAQATPLLRGNRVLGNAQVGLYCCDGATPIVVDNDICESGKAGVLVKTGAAPSVLRNTIADGREAGVYVLERGAGVFDGNRIHGNGNAGVLVTTRGGACVVRNVVHHNAYEGVWVCRGGGGTFCDNDLRDNDRGAHDVEADAHVTWSNNREA